MKKASSLIREQREDFQGAAEGSHIKEGTKIKGLLHRIICGK